MMSHRLEQVVEQRRAALLLAHDHGRARARVRVRRREPLERREVVEPREKR